MRFKDISEILSTKKVGIAGCGGLGSNCALALVRSGLGNLVIADFDIVNESNLNRQFFFSDQTGMKKIYALRDNLLRIRPSCHIETHDMKLGPSEIVNVFSSCDVIVEAFDEAGHKEMIIETVLDKFPDIPLVSGLGLAGYGNSNALRIKKHGNLYICGDMRSEVSEDQPPLAPRVGIVANMQANQVLELLIK